MSNAELRVHRVLPRPVAIRQQAGIPALLAAVLVLQQRTAMALGVVAPRGDAAAAQALRRLHARLGMDAHVLASLLELATPAPTATRTPAATTIEDRL